MSTFQRAAVIQARVIGALMLRDLVAIGGTRLGYFQLLMRPCAYIVVIYAGGRAFDGLTPAGIPLLTFVITGFLTWMAFLQAFLGLSIRGSLKLLMFPHLTPLDLIVAKLAVQFVIYTTMFVGLCGLGALFDQAPLPADPLGVMVAYWSALALGGVVGVIAASISRFTTLLDDLFMLVRRVGHVLSGVAFLATDTPSALVKFMQWNPLFHCIEWVRQAWWPAYASPVADPPYIFLCIFFLLAIGLAFERSTRRFQEAPA